MSRDWTKEYWDIPDDAKDSYVELKQENEQLKKQLDIAIDCLKQYANKDHWDNHFEVDWCIEIKKFDNGECDNGEFYAENALQQIKELTK